MNKPQKLNAINAADSFEMEEIFDRFGADPDLRVAILTGAGRAFSAGHDLLDNPDDPMPSSGFGGLTERRGLTKPIVAAVNGFALGGGLGMALSCDIIIASESAELGVVQGKIGGLDLSGGPHRLARQIPYRHAMAMCLTGRRYKAAETLPWGLVNEVVPDDQLMKVARRWAEDIIACAPLSVELHKHLVQESAVGRVFVDWVANTHHRYVKFEFDSKDLHEGIEAFGNKRKPTWSGQMIGGQSVSEYLAKNIED
jgi:enoyl-CoA hydratase/carnithine racemase